MLAQSPSLQMLPREASRLERTYYRALNNLLRLRQVRESSNKKIEKRTESQNRTLVTNHQQPIHQQPIHQQPPTNDRSPTTGHQPPATNHAPPTTHLLPPTTP